MIGPLAFLVTVLFAPGLAGAATTPRWAILAIFVPWLLPTSFKFTTGHLLIFVYLLWASISLTWTADLNGGLLAVSHLALILGLFCIGGNLKSLRPVYIWMAFGIGVSSIVSVAQIYGWKALDQGTAPGGLFYNANFMAEAAVMVLIALIVERFYWLIPLVLPAAFLPIARGPIVALIIALAFWARNKIAVAIVAVILLGGAVYSVQSNYRISSIDERFAIWRDTIDGMTFWGHGIGSFYGQYPASATRTNTLASRPDHAHNDLLEAVYELGPIGCLLLLLGYCCLHSGRSISGRAVFVGFAVIGLVGFPLHNPVTAFLISLVAGHLCGDRASLRAAFHVWRSRFRSWYAKRTLRYAAGRRAVMAA